MRKRHVKIVLLQRQVLMYRQMQVNSRTIQSRVCLSRSNETCRVVMIEFRSLSVSAEIPNILLR